MIPEHLAELVDAARQRRAERRQDRAELQANRAAGLRLRHHNRLAHHTTNGDAGHYPCPQCPTHHQLDQLLDHLNAHIEPSTPEQP